jgi:hypothetical protein
MHQECLSSAENKNVQAKVGFDPAKNEVRAVCCAATLLLSAVFFFFLSAVPLHFTRTRIYRKVDRFIAKFINW